MTTLRLRLLAVILAAGLTAGCESVSSMFEDDEIPLENRSAREIFEVGEAFLADDEPEQAARTFDEVERLFPFSQLAKRAMIMSAFSYYEAGNMPEGRASAGRYLDLFPSDEDAAYAQYLIALTYYDTIVDTGRDQANTRFALRELSRVVQRYPASDYARDAQLKIDLTRDHLAGKEMEVGRYYLKRGHYLAAINRFRVVLETYQTTAQAPEALHRLVEAYLALGIDREAQTAGAVLGENFVGSEWYSASYGLLTGRDLEPLRDADSWMDRVFRRVVRGDWL